MSCLTIGLAVQHVLLLMEHKYGKWARLEIFSDGSGHITDRSDINNHRKECEFDSIKTLISLLS